MTKKFFKNLALVAIAALSIAGCDDVPPPFVEPGGDNNPPTQNDGGTWNKPFSVSELISNQSGKAVWVQGYIVGSIPESETSTKLQDMTFTADGANHTNICIAATPTEKDYRQCVAVQLPAGSDARENLNLKNNPAMLGNQVWLKGQATSYCAAPGMKAVSKYTLKTPTAEDDKDDTNTPVEGAKGDGSLKNPFNAAGALNYTKALPAGQATAEKFYIKGIVCESNKMDINTQFKNATFHISEDGKATSTQFLIFRTKGLKGADITSKDDVQVGDEVVIYAALVNYMGNTPETNQGGVIYAQKRNGVDLTPGEGGGETGGEGQGGDEGGGGTPVVPAGENIFQNGDFEQWENGLPLNWKSKSSAGNVKIEQSTVAHGGSYAAQMGFSESANKRMAYKETTLAAGTYKFKFYAKGTNTDPAAKCQTRPGHVAILSDGSVDSANYKYGSYASLSATEWTLVEHEFTLAAETTVCLVIMSPKTSGYHTAQNILVDDATLVKIN